MSNEMLNYAVAFLIFFACPVGWAMCAEDLTWSAVNQDLHSIGRGPAARADAEVFWSEGWPVLHDFAKAQGTSVTEFMREHIELMLLNYETFQDAETIREYRRRLASSNTAIEKIQNYAPGKKLKAPHWKLVGFANHGIRLIARHASLLEQVLRTTPSFNPHRSLTRERAMALIDSLELSSLDHVLTLHRNADEVEARKAEAAKSENVIIEPVPEPVVTPSATAPPDERPDFKTTLRSGATLQIGGTYEVTDAFDNHLQVILRPEFRKDYEAEPVVANRLIRSIMTGRGNAGVITLFAIGPGIVELKHHLHGHKRIFACLRGRRLFLRKLMAIKADGGTYSRRIPADFCRDIL